MQHSLFDTDYRRDDLVKRVIRLRQAIVAAVGTPEANTTDQSLDFHSGLAHLDIVAAKLRQEDITVGLIGPFSSGKNATYIGTSRPGTS